MNLGAEVIIWKSHTNLFLERKALSKELYFLSTGSFFRKKVFPKKEKSIGICIEKMRRVFNDNQIDGEIVIADNSTDNTPEIAKSMGAKVIVPEEHGYGNF